MQGPQVSVDGPFVIILERSVVSCRVVILSVCCVILFVRSARNMLGDGVVEVVEMSSFVVQLGRRVVVEIVVDRLLLLCLQLPAEVPARNW